MESVKVRWGLRVAQKSREIMKKLKGQSIKGKLRQKNDHSYGHESSELAFDSPCLALPEGILVEK